MTYDLHAEPNHPSGRSYIITDPNGDFLSHFFKKGDSVLNLFDRRGKDWSIFNQLNSSYDHERYAKSVIPLPALLRMNGHGYAQLLFAEITKSEFLIWMDDSNSHTSLTLSWTLDKKDINPDGMSLHYFTCIDP